MHTPVSILATGLIAAVLVGCGGDSELSSDPPSPAAPTVSQDAPRRPLAVWRRDLERECGSLTSDIERISFFVQARPLRRKEDIDQEGIVARTVAKTVPVIRRSLGRMTRIRPPEAVEAEMNEFLASLSGAADGLEELPAVLASDDPARAAELTARFDALAEQAQAFVDTYELPRCARAALLAPTGG